MCKTTFLILLHILCWSQLFGQQNCGVQHPAYTKDQPLPQYTSSTHAPTGTELRGIDRCTIAVVVHVVWYKDRPEENIPDWQIDSQIDILNETFNAQNNTRQVPAKFKELVADVDFEFCLAGITRTKTNFDSIGNIFIVKNNFGERLLFRTDLGGIDAWDTQKYLNIWVANTGRDFLGFGTLPDSTFRARNQLRDYEDGIILNPRNFGYTIYPPYHLGRVGTHEVGHYFNLKHIWGDDNTCESDDEVDDTPNQRQNYTGCPALFESQSCGDIDMFMNYMDNTWDACQLLFTEGQKARMRSAIEIYRPELVNNGSCGTPNQPTTASFTVYPNPASNIFRLSYDGPFQENVQIHIYDTAGREVHSAIHNSDNLVSVISSQWSEGLYFVSLSIGDEVYTQKLFIYHP